MNKRIFATMMAVVMAFASAAALAENPMTASVPSMEMAGMASITATMAMPKSLSVFILVMIFLIEIDWSIAW